MTDLLVTVSLDAATGFSDDTAQNSFAFRTDDFTAATLLDIKNAVAGFYNTLNAGQTRKVSQYMSSILSRAAGGCILKTYDLTGHLDGSPMGSPIDVDSFTLGTHDSNTSLAQQTALVLTLRGRDAVSQPVELGDGSRPRSRRSGRLYIGPLGTIAFGVGAEGEPARPSSQMMADVLLAAEGLQDALVDGDAVWCVWSRSSASLFGIERVEVDNSFDVLRSRKSATTSRSIRTFAPEPSLVLGA